MPDAPPIDPAESEPVRPCVYHDDASICLDHPITANHVALRAENLQVGSDLTVWTAANESTYTIAEGTGVIAWLDAPADGVALRVVVRGTTAGGKLISGPLRAR